MSYEDFIRSKGITAVPTGIDDVPELGSYLFPFQKVLVEWALRRGRACLFTDTGTGKTAMEGEFASQALAYCEAMGIGDKALMLAPLAVADQTVKMLARFGIEVRYCRRQSDVKPGITITNYDMLHEFDPLAFPVVVADESGILKNFDGKTRNLIVESFRHAPFRLGGSATPAPNDVDELGNHADFLGIMSMSEMHSTWFTHDGGETQKWRLKKHGENDFWRWVCSWAALVKRPSDLGFSDEGFDLPPLQHVEHVIPATIKQAHDQGLLFAESAKTLNEQRRARKATLDDRIAIARDLVLAEPREPWIVWCELNTEADGITAAIPGAIQIKGSDEREEKRKAMMGFTEGRIRVLVTKPKIAGMGMNWQHCARIIDIGATHSFEQRYQTIRRCWRYGQKRPVMHHVIHSALEGDVVRNLERKMADAEKLAERMREYTQVHVRKNVTGQEREEEEYHPTKPMQIPAWLTSESA